MGTTLAHGIYLPSEGERNCYAGLKLNWETLDQKVADIVALQSAIAGALHREIVESLPTTDIDPNTIYMILSGTSATENIYDEYMYISNAWELIGTSATDLTNYYTKAEVDGKLLLKASASDLTSHTGDTTIHVTASDKAKWNTVALIKQLRLVNTQVGSATTIAFANIDDTNGIKVGDKCMDLDAKMFEITAVDTTNQTVTVGSALIDLALDANVVHTSEINSSGIGIIEAVKEVGGVDFNTLTTQGLYGTNASGSTNNPENSPCVVQVIKRGNSVIQIASVSSSAYKSRYIRYCADITAQSPVWGSWIKFATDDNVMHLSGDETKNGELTASKFISNYIQSDTGNIQIQSIGTNRSCSMFNGASAGDGGGFWAYGKNSANGSDCRMQIYNTTKSRYERVDLVNSQFLPTPSGELDCGGTSNKWKSINGINPGALSLPDFSNAIDISSYITVTDGSTTSNSYTPPNDGYISVNLGRSSGAIGLVLSNGKIEACVRENTFPDNHRECGGFIPVQKNDTVVITSCLADSIIWAYFIPCQGNV